MPDIVETIRAVDETGAATSSATSNLEKMKTATAGTKSITDSLSSAMVGLNQGIELANKAIEAIRNVYEQTIGVTLEYANTVKQLSLVSGASAEETSRMIQMTDDFEISVGTLETAMRGAAIKGVALTTDSLAKMSDEYLKLAPGTERNTYLIQNFGRSGLEMANLLNQGSKAIRDLSTAQEDNMLLTERQIAQTTAYKRFLDSQADSVRGMQYEIGMKLIPDMTLLLTKEEQLKLVLQEGKKGTLENAFASSEWAYNLQLAADHNSILAYKTRQLGGDLLTQAHNMELARDATRNLGAAEAAAGTSAADLAKHQQELQTATANVASAQDRLSQAQLSWGNSVGGTLAADILKITGETQKYKDALAGIDNVLGTNMFQQDLMKTKLEALATGFATGKIKQEDFEKQLGAIKDAFRPLDEQVIKATTDLDTLQQKLDALNGQTVTATVIVNMVQIGSGPFNSPVPSTTPTLPPFGGNSSSTTNNTNVTVHTGATNPDQLARTIARQIKSRLE